MLIHKIKSLQIFCSYFHSPQQRALKWVYCLHPDKLLICLQIRMQPFRINANLHICVCKYYCEPTSPQDKQRQGWATTPRYSRTEYARLAIWCIKPALPPCHKIGGVRFELTKPKPRFYRPHALTTCIPTSNTTIVGKHVLPFNESS